MFHLVVLFFHLVMFHLGEMLIGKASDRAKLGPEFSVKIIKTGQVFTDDGYFRV